MNISFGRKIPIATCQLLDKKRNAYIPTVVYLFDGKDKSDISELQELEDSWEYRDEIIDNIKYKNTNHRLFRPCDTAIYTIEKYNGEKLGLCCADNRKKSLEVRFLESQSDKKYKFAGQCLLAAMGQTMLKTLEQEKFIIRSSLASAYSFYQDTCGFIEANYSDLEMDRENTQRFIKRTEERTKAPIIELEA